MGHSKLPWKERIDNPIFNENPIPMPEYVIYGEGGKRLIASVWTKTKLGDKEAEANANLIVTAVNVMPEVKDLLQAITDLDPDSRFNRDTLTIMADNLLKQLESVE